MIWTKCGIVITALAGWMTLTAGMPHQEAKQTIRQTAAHTMPSHVAKNENKFSEGCPGTRQPQLSCDAISAQAALDQATDADAGFWISVGGLALGIVTLGAAGAAAWYAKVAADHTRRSADAAWGAVESAKVANQIAADSLDADKRPWIMIGDIEFGGVSKSLTVLSYGGEVSIENKSGGLALNVKIEFCMFAMFDRPPTIFDENVERGNWGNQAIYRNLTNPLTPGEVRKCGVVGGFDTSTINDNSETIFFAVRVEYNSTTSDKRRSSAQLYAVRARSPADEQASFRSEHNPQEPINMIAFKMGQPKIT